MLRKSILSLSDTPSPHTGAALADKIYGLLSDWGIVENISSLTLDNASANDVCISYLKQKLNSRKTLMLNGQLFHIRCCAHILNLIVQEGLKEVDIIVEKIRDSVRYVRGSQSRKENFLECVKTLSLDRTLGLRQDVPIRWNSTFMMLKSAIYYKTSFEHLSIGDANYTACLDAFEWERAEKLCKFLSPFYDLTCLFSGSKYPTSNLFFPLVVLVYHNLKMERDCEESSFQSMAVKMIGKFEKYWIDFNEILAIAVILDPRFKFEFEVWALKKLYGDNAQRHIDRIHGRLVALFDEYSQRLVSTPGSSSRVLQRNYVEVDKEVTLQKENENFFTDFDVVNEFDSDVQKSELEAYLSAKKKLKRADKLDILKFWEKHINLYPTIGIMARDILCIPISTVASESAFSCSDRIIDRFRSSIKHKNAEALLCWRDWMYGEQDMLEAISEFEVYTEDVLNPHGNATTTAKDSVIIGSNDST